MIKCPFCNYEADVSEFKLLRDPWNFRFYTVKMLECPKCHNVFSISPRGDNISEFVIKVKPT